MIIVVLAIGIRLSMGPISLGFLTSMIEDSFAANPDGLKLTVADTVLTWSGINHDVTLQIVGLELRDRDQRLMAKLPSADIDLSVKALLTGTLAPTAVALVAPEISIRRAADGTVELGLGGAVAAENRPDDGRSPVSELIALLRRGPGNSESLRHLATLSVVRAHLLIEDEVTLKSWIASDASFELMRGLDGAVALRADVALSSGGEQVSLHIAGAVPAQATQDVTLALNFAGLVPALFDSGGEIIGPAGGIVMPLSGQVALAVDNRGEPRTLSFDVRGGAGGINLPELFPEGLTLDSIGLKGSFDMTASVLRFDALQARRGEFSVDAAGTITIAQAGLGLDLTIRMPKAPIDELGALWPVKLSVNGRRWVMQNIRGGHITNGVFRLKAPPGALDRSEPPGDIFAGDFDLADTSVNYLNGLPPVAHIEGKAHMTVDAIDVAFEAGKVDMGASGIVTLEGGTARVTDFNKQDQTGDISFTASGPARAALALVDRPPLGYAGKMGIDPSRVSGNQATKARFVLPLVADLDLDNLNFTTSSHLTNLGIDKVVGPLSMTAGDITISVDQTKAVGEGKAMLGPTAVALSWSESFTVAPGGVTTRLSASGLVDEKLREQLGMPADRHLTGPLDTTVTLEGRGQSIGAITVAMKLDQAAIDVPELGWSKKAAVPGTLSFRVQMAAQRYKIDALQFKAPALDIAGGTGELTRDGALLRLAVNRARFGRTDLSFDISRPAADQRFQAKLRGAVLDLSEYLARAAPERLPEADRPDPAKPDSLPDFDFDIAIDRILLDDAASLSAFKSNGSHFGGLWRSAVAHGTLGANATFNLTLAPAAGYREFRITSGEAGTWTRLLGIYSDIEGGSLSLVARIDDTKPNRPLTADLDIRDFKLVRTPTLARILTLASLTGIAEAVGGEGISFEALKARVHMESDVMRIEKARAYGTSIGMTLAGTYDTWGRSISVGGTIVPSYGLNRFLGAIPLVGDILTGGEGGGLFAFNYSVVGAIENPDVNVNALSALAPGILRDIVSAVDGSNSAADAAAPPIIEVPQKRQAPPPAK
ncbi:hypothetical protein D3874_08295 [Oleomonas cavernae]|uniref:YhdP central domain-containing protein n=1 Tax=Oleomonas cavernae TaxID=2320859 RepID=A0A418WAH4_9PROT|nr:hypothetical protein D3874_08295 [Oleomonas cavernae]